MKYAVLPLLIAMMASPAFAQSPADAMSRKSQNWQNLQNSRQSIARPSFTVNEYDSSLKNIPVPVHPIADGGASKPPVLVDDSGMRPRPPIVDDNGLRPPILIDDSGMRPRPPIADGDGAYRPPVDIIGGDVVPKKSEPLPHPIIDGGLIGGGVVPKKSEPLPHPIIDGGLIGGGVVPEKSEPLPPPVNHDRYVSIEHSDPIPPPVSLMPQRSEPIPLSR